MYEILHAALGMIVYINTVNKKSEALRYQKMKEIRPKKFFSCMGTEFVFFVEGLEQKYGEAIFESAKVSIFL